MSIPVSGFGSNLTPDFSETSRVQMKKGSAKESVQEKGANLAKDSLEIPFEQQAKIGAQEAEAGRPSLPPLFKMRFVEDREGDELSRDYYLALRKSLSPPLKGKLENEEKLPFNERDPDLIALDGSLKFEGNLLALADSLSAPLTGNEPALPGAEHAQALPQTVQKELSSYGSLVCSFLDRYLSQLSRNDASYELFQHVSNQIKEALNLLNYKQDTEG